MTMMIQFGKEEIFYPIYYNLTKHQEAKKLAEALGKGSYEFVDIFFPVVKHSKEGKSMIVIECWETRKYSSEPLKTRLFVASSREEAEKMVKEWCSKKQEYFEYHAQILTLEGNELVPQSHNLSQEAVEAIEREEWEW